MSGPGLLPGGDTLLPSSPTSSEPRGVFAQFPGATKKYNLNRGVRDNEFRETMARMFIQMSEKERELFVNSVPPETRPLAKVLAGVGSGASGGTGFIDFLLTNVTEQYSEKIQVMETLADDYVIFVFGQHAPTFRFSGALLNTYQDDQRVWLTRLYNDVLRGTQLARRKKLLRIRYDSVIVSGVMTDMQMGIQADQEDHVSFAFGFIPTQFIIYTPSMSSPTQLKSAFTPASAYALSSTQTAPTTRTRVAGYAVPPAQATRTRRSEKNNHALHISSKVSAGPIAKKAPLETKASTVRSVFWEGMSRTLNTYTPGLGSLFSAL